MAAAVPVLSVGDYVRKRTGVQNGFLGALQSIGPSTVGYVYQVMSDNGDVAVIFDDESHPIFAKPGDLCLTQYHHEVHRVHMILSVVVCEFLCYDAACRESHTSQHCLGIYLIIMMYICV